MIVINEVLFDPEGKDAEGEFVELFNNGDASVNLQGYRLVDKSDKQFVLSGTLDSHAYLSLPYSTTRISLNNTDESLFLYNGQELVDQVEVVGAVVSGESLSRLPQSESFVFTPLLTPGGVNAFPEAVLAATKASVSHGPDDGLYYSSLWQAAPSGLLIGFILGGVGVWFYRILYNEATMVADYK